MITIIIIILIAALIPTVVIISTFLINKLSNFNFEKSTPFECGFDPHNSARIPFSIRFFILAVLFLVFDIEIALLLPIPSITFININTKIVLIIFTIILLLGLYHEWKESSLEWK